jgi:hypothetical protein
VIVGLVSAWDRQYLQKRCDEEVQKLNELELKYFQRHPKMVQQKALVGEIGGQLNDVHEVV